MMLKTQTESLRARQSERLLIIAVFLCKLISCFDVFVVMWLSDSFLFRNNGVSVSETETDHAIEENTFYYSPLSWYVDPRFLCLSLSAADQIARGHSDVDNNVQNRTPP